MISPQNQVDSRRPWRTRSNRDLFPQRLWRDHAEIRPQPCLRPLCHQETPDTWVLEPPIHTLQAGMRHVDLTQSDTKGDGATAEIIGWDRNLEMAWDTEGW